MTVRSTLLLCLFAALTLGSLPVAVLAAAPADPAGRVSVVLGEVVAVDASGTSRRLGRQDPVFEGDSLRSASRGRAQLRFTDGSRLSLRPDSELSIDDHAFEAARPSAARQTLSLTRGGFRTRTGRIADANRAGYRVQSPLGVIGVRGTIFDAHQQPNGPLHLGVGDGTIEIETIAGVIGRIGAGEDFDFLRVNPDGSIDFLLQAPDEFVSTPELAARGDEYRQLPELGSPGDATPSAGGGSAESTVGLEVEPSSQPVVFVNDPGLRGLISRSESGNGAQPFVDSDQEQESEPLQPALDPDLEALLLADNRIGLALLPGTGGEDEGGLFGGIATVNAPVLALDTSIPGLASDLTSNPTSADRAALLDAADVILQSDSGGVDFEENVNGIAGLVWGRYEAPLSLFLDPADRSRVLALERDILFALGEPVDIDGLAGIAPMDGLLEYEVTRFDAFSSGLLVNDVLGSGTLDLNSGSYSGFLDILLGATDSMDELSLFVEFQSQVAAGVLQDLTLSADLIDLITETTSDADGTVAGFFTGNETGDEAAFLQLAFDLRAVGRDDADITGLALLERLAIGPIRDGLTPAEVEALTAGFAYTAVTCCFEDPGMPAPALLAGLATDARAGEGADALLGIALTGAGDPAGATDPDLLVFPPALVARRGDATVVNFTDGALLDIQGSESIGAFQWDAGNDSLQAFDVESGVLDRAVGERILAITGVPTPTENLVGWRRYGAPTLLDGFGTFEEGVERTVLGINRLEMAFNVNFADGSVTDGRLLFGVETDPDEFRFQVVAADFDGQIVLEDNRPFAEMRLIDGSLNGGEGPSLDALNLDRSFIGGFFTGDEGDAFASTFLLESAGTNFDRVILTGSALLTQQDLSLSMAEATSLQASTLAFVGAACCSVDRAFAGRSPGPDAPLRVLSLGVDADGNPLQPGDPGFLSLPPGQILRSTDLGDPFSFGFGSPFLFDFPATDTLQARWVNPLRVEAESGAILQELDETFLFVTATPSPLDLLQSAGFTTFAGSGSTSGGFVSTRLSNAGFTGGGGAASFNVDLATGEVFAGQLFLDNQSLTEDLQSPPNLELGWELFFTGQVALSEDGSFVRFDLQDGSYAGSVPIDLAASRVEGFFAGEAGFRFNGAFNVQTVPDETTGEVAAIGGIFGITNVNEELRLDASQVASWVREGPDGEMRPGLAIAALRLLGQQNLLFLGRGGPVALGEPFTLGANRLNVLEGGELVADTRRADFFAQPFDFVLVQETAFGGFLADEIPELFDPDARPGGAPNFAGFEVSWGAWNNGGADAPPRILNDPQNPEAAFNAGDETYFASINPTPTSQLPREGTASYGGAAAFIGGGRGPLSQFSQARLDALSVGFGIDFATGEISGGEIQLEYGVGSTIRWTGSFEGSLNGAVTDLRLTALDVEEQISGSFVPVGPGSLEVSGITGVLTGPTGERHAGGFNFFREIPTDFNDETVEGLWVVDRLP